MRYKYEGGAGRKGRQDTPETLTAAKLHSPTVGKDVRITLVEIPIRRRNKRKKTKKIDPRVDH